MLVLLKNLPEKLKTLGAVIDPTPSNPDSVEEIGKAEQPDQPLEGESEVELIDDDGEVYDETKEMLHHLAEESLEAPHNILSLSVQTTDNSMFDMDGRSIDVGMIYLLIDISSFFKLVKLPDAESKIIGMYSSLMQKEKEGQQAKYIAIKEMLDDLGMKIEEKITSHHVTEQRIDLQLKRLTLILAQCRASISTGNPRFKELYARTQRNDCRL